MSFFSDILDINKITVKTAFLIFLISALLLFTPPHLLTQLQLDDFKKEYGKYFGFAFIFSISFLFIALLNWIQTFYKNNIRKKRYKKDIEELLKDIDYNEQAVLREFYLHSSKSLDMPIDDPTIAGMLSKGLLTHLSSMGQMSLEGLMMPLSINKILVNKITFHLLGMPDTNNPTEEQINNMRNLRPHWAKMKDRRLSNRWY